MHQPRISSRRQGRPRTAATTSTLAMALQATENQPALSSCLDGSERDARWAAARSVPVPTAERAPEPVGESTTTTARRRRPQDVGRPHSSLNPLRDTAAQPNTSPPALPSRPAELGAGTTGRLLPLIKLTTGRLQTQRAARRGSSRSLDRPRAHAPRTLVEVQPNKRGASVCFADAYAL